jgi:hypothetical protein
LGIPAIAKQRLVTPQFGLTDQEHHEIDAAVVKLVEDVAQPMIFDRMQIVRIIDEEQITPSPRLIRLGHQSFDEALFQGFG